MTARPESYNEPCTYQEALTISSAKWIGLDIFWAVDLKITVKGAGEGEKSEEVERSGFAM